MGRGANASRSTDEPPGLEVSAAFSAFSWAEPAIGRRQQGLDQFHAGIPGNAPIARIEIEKRHRRPVGPEPAAPCHQALAEVAAEAHEVAPQHDVAEIPTRQRRHRLYRLPDQIQVMKPADIQANVGRGVAGDAVARVGFNQLDYPIARIALQLQFAQAAIVHGAQKPVAHPIGVRIVDGRHDAGRTEVDGGGAHLLKHASRQSLAVLAVTGEVNHLGGIGPLDDLLRHHFRRNFFGQAEGGFELLGRLHHNHLLVQQRMSLREA